ncbi:MAG TPA: phenylacetate--CoA ligase [Spirochaetia bacterium]|nr:MAG: phenylacetate--CoA ligase [Spirochaetes bacterium GWB1_36_13]HCL56757.1 phenylacetate--CoA ligase [Spirochaetia bacterium]
MYYDKAIETMKREDLKKLQLERLQKTVHAAYQSPFYKKRFDSIGLKPKDIRTLEDIYKIPFTTKDDLRAAYPDLMLAVPKNQPVRIHSSSGTTGRATVIFFTKKDIDVWADLMGRCLYMAGMRPDDVFQNMVSYGLFTGGLGFHYGAERFGSMVIPAGGGNTAKQITLIKDFGTTYLHITPSYALHIAYELEQMKIPASSLGLKGLFCGAEPYSESTRKKLEEIYRIPVFNSYGLSEMNGPGVGFECQEKEDIHIWEDNYIVEIIDPQTGEAVLPGERGELVLTTINREAMPILRYRTKDLTFLHKDLCKCGRTHAKIGRIIGRSDDMLIVRGVNLFPSQIEAVIMEIPEVGNNYQIVIDRSDEHLDRLTVKVEIDNKVFHGELKDLKMIQKKIKHAIKEEIMIQPEIELLEPNTLPPSEGKAKRVIDLRNI